jgi:hypothetical protein
MFLCRCDFRRMGVWQGVAMDSLKYCHLCPAGGATPEMALHHRIDNLRPSSAPGPMATRRRAPMRHSDSLVIEPRTNEYKD